MWYGKWYDKLIIFRGIQGLGGGIMMPMAMIVWRYVHGERSAKWQGILVRYTVLLLIGPQVGGWI